MEYYKFLTQHYELSPWVSGLKAQVPQITVVLWDCSGYSVLRGDTMLETADFHAEMRSCQREVLHDIIEHWRVASVTLGLFLVVINILLQLLTSVLDDQAVLTSVGIEPLQYEAIVHTSDFNKK